MAKYLKVITLISNSFFSPFSLQTQSGQQRRSMVSQAHGLAWVDGVSSGRFAAGAFGQRHTHPGSLWQGAGPGIYRGLCAGVLATWL